jgi:hypothetical protein
MLQSGGPAVVPLMQSLATMLPSMLGGTPQLAEGFPMALPFPAGLMPDQALGSSPAGPQPLAMWPPSVPHQNGGAEAGFARMAAASVPAQHPSSGYPAAALQPQQWPGPEQLLHKQQHQQQHAHAQQQPDWAALASAGVAQGLPVHGSFPGMHAPEPQGNGGPFTSAGGAPNGSAGFSVGDLSAQNALLLASGAPALKVQQEQQRLHHAGSR